MLIPGSERRRQKKLDLWDRFHVADGLIFTLARLTVACGIIAVVLNVGVTVGSSLVNVYNGLGRSVNVSIGEHSIALAPFSHTRLTLGDEENYVVKTMTDDGRLIEQFDVNVPLGSDKNVYNIAAASTLVEWDAVYGSARSASDRMIGPQRWTTTTDSRSGSASPTAPSPRATQAPTASAIPAEAPGTTRAASTPASAAIRSPDRASSSSMDAHEAFASDAAAHTEGAIRDPPRSV